MKWWAQSFIVGIPKIIVGYRDDDGIVSRLKTIEVKQLPKESQVIYFLFHIYYFFYFLTNWSSPRRVIGRRKLE